MRTIAVMSWWIVLCLPLAAQQTWKVSCHGGPGIHFTDVQAAVDAAAEGDTVMVILTSPCPGASPFPTIPTINKAVNLLGVRQLASLPPAGTPPILAEFEGVLTIRDVPAGKRVLVSCVNPAPIGAVFGQPWIGMSGLRVLNCAGTVIIDSFWVGNAGYPNQVLEIVNSADVTLNYATITFGPTPLRIVNSTVRMSWSLMHCYLPPAQFGGYAQTQHAIDLENSTLTLTGSSIRGADAMSGQPPRAGVVHHNSVLNLGPGTTLRGGFTVGGNGKAWWPRIYGVSQSVVRIDPRVSIAGQVSPAAVPTSMPATYTHPAVANQDFGIVIAGPVDGFALLLLSDLAPSWTSTPFGGSLLDPHSVTAVDIHHLPASSQGFASKYYFVPPYAQNAYPYVVQSLTLSPTGQLGFTAPMPFLVGWEHGRIP